MTVACWVVTGQLGKLSQPKETPPPEEYKMWCKEYLGTDT